MLDNSDLTDPVTSAFSLCCCWCSKIHWSVAKRCWLVGKMMLQLTTEEGETRGLVGGILIQLLLALTSSYIESIVFWYIWETTGRRNFNVGPANQREKQGHHHNADRAARWHHFTRSTVAGMGFGQSCTPVHWITPQPANAFLNALYRVFTRLQSFGQYWERGTLQPRFWELWGVRNRPIW